MGESEADVVIAFNEAINARDLDRLQQLMSPDHRFVDTAGNTVDGKQSCRAAWASFFESFPDYRNEFETLDVIEPGNVVVTGRSVCSVSALVGPARWRVSVADGLVHEWRVEDLADP